MFLINLHSFAAMILRIKDILREKKVVAKELAKELEMTENAFSLIVNAKRQPRYNVLIKIAKALDVDVRDLFISTKVGATKEELMSEIELRWEKLKELD